MSRQALQDFLRAIEHHQGLRLEARACNTDQELITLAHRHGFPVTDRDLHGDHRDSAIGRWFDSSQIKRSFHSPSP